MSPLDLLLPQLETENGKIPLPVRCEPIWNKAMGKRLMIARKFRCPRVDRRTPDWRHKDADITGKSCGCISQIEAARQLGISQPQISRLEGGKTIAAMPSIPQFYSVFGDAIYYILTGINPEQYEAFGKKTGRKLSQEVESKS